MSCKLMCMKCQNLFSGKNIKRYFIMLSVEFFYPECSPAVVFSLLSVLLSRDCFSRVKFCTAFSSKVTCSCNPTFLFFNSKFSFSTVSIMSKMEEKTIKTISKRSIQKIFSLFFHIPLASTPPPCPP